MTPPAHNHESFACGDDCPNLAHLRAKAAKKPRMTTSPAEHLLEVQLEQAGIPFEREYRFAPEDWCRANGFVTPTGRPKRWRADFAVHDVPWLDLERPILVEIDGGTWIQGRHNRGSSIAAEYQKRAAASILGYRTLHCTTEQVNDGTCLSWIQQALGLEDAA